MNALSDFQRASDEFFLAAYEIKERSVRFSFAIWRPRHDQIDAARRIDERAEGEIAEPAMLKAGRQQRYAFARLHQGKHAGNQIRRLNNVRRKPRLRVSRCKRVRRGIS